MREKLIAYLQREGVSGAFAVKDLRSGEICSFNEDEVVASASLIKMFILIRAFQKIRAGEMTLDDQIEVRAEDVVDFSVLLFLDPRKYSLAPYFSASAFITCQ